ncbi:MAG: hypothetical protein GY797_38800 [Deltaproteobacteria bacterium]|nr:hypothetical protein [Deltaproteobacteria bacterium]
MNPKCVYCKEHHDSKIVCSTYKKEKVIKQEYEYYLDVANGKYTLYMEKSGVLKALRYGEPWQDLTGNNLVFNLMAELVEAKEKIKKALAEYGEEEWD